MDIVYYKDILLCGLLYNMIFNISGYISPNIKLAHNSYCVVHSIASTYYSAKYLINLDDYSYYMFTIISTSYFINDILYYIWYYNRQSFMYITHHVVTLIALSNPNYLMGVALFLAESSNIPNNLTHRAIIVNSSNYVIKKCKLIQIYSWIFLRNIMMGVLMVYYHDMFMNMKVYVQMICIFLYSISIFWSFKLYKSYLKS